MADAHPSPAVNGGELACPLAIARHVMNLRVVEKAIAHYTNKERRKRNLRKVRHSGTLVKAARGHAEWCAGRNRMTHTGSGGTQPGQRARQAGYPSQGVSENMWQQHGRNNTTYKSRFRWRSDWEFGKAAVITWMNSPGHRSNLLDPRWTDIGVGLSRRNGHTMLVQMFGDRPAPPPKIKVPVGEEIQQTAGRAVQPLPQLVVPYSPQSAQGWQSLPRRPSQTAPLAYRVFGCAYRSTHCDRGDAGHEARRVAHGCHDHRLNGS